MTEGDAETEQHFSRYFYELLFIKCRRRLRSRQDVEDAAQETLVRVLEKLRRGEGLKDPRRLGSFVNSVCNFVLLERYRSDKKHPPINENQPDPIDGKVDLDAPLITEERKKCVRRALAQLPAKDCAILKMLFFEERTRQAICDEFDVTPTYLRVLVHRAKARFRKALDELGGWPSLGLFLACAG